ncbi:MAG: DNRLRE domain-containing protein [Planctomycetota bacterium]
MKPSSQFAVVAGLCLLGLQSSQAEEYSFQQGVSGYTGTRDTTIGEDWADESYSDYYVFWMDGWMAGAGEEQGLLGFDGIFGADPGQIPYGSPIVSATVSLYVMNAGSGFTVHRMLIPWEETVTWNGLNDGVQANGIEAVVEPDFSIGEGTHAEHIPIGPLDVDVTASLRAWSAGESDYGWAFLPFEGGSDAVAFYSSEASSYHPVLTVVIPEPATLFLVAAWAVVPARRRHS